MQHNQVCRAEHARTSMNFLQEADDQINSANGPMRLVLEWALSALMTFYPVQVNPDP